MNVLNKVVQNVQKGFASLHCGYYLIGSQTEKNGESENENLPGMSALSG